MAWDIVDFAVFGGLLAGVALAYKVATLKSKAGSFRAGAALALVTALLLIWVNGAVGIIGSENNDVNLMYGGVLLIGLIGALISRFSPRGMSRTMICVAAAQVMVAVIALGWKIGISGPVWPKDVLGATVVFTGLWLGSAWLFHRAARGRVSVG